MAHRMVPVADISLSAVHTTREPEMLASCEYLPDDDSGPSHSREFNVLVGKRKGELTLVEKGIVFHPTGSAGIEELWKWDEVKFRSYPDKRMVKLIKKDDTTVKIIHPDKTQTQLFSDDLDRAMAHHKQHKQDESLVHLPRSFPEQDQNDSHSLLIEEVSTEMLSRDPPPDADETELPTHSRDTLTMEVYMPRHRPEKQVYEAAKKRRAQLEETNNTAHTPPPTPPTSSRSSEPNTRSHPMDPPMSSWVQRHAEADIEVGRQDDGNGAVVHDSAQQTPPPPQEDSMPLYTVAQVVAADNGSRPGAVPVREKAPRNEQWFRNMSIGLSVAVLLLVGAVAGIAVAFAKSSGSSPPDRPFNCIKSRLDLVKAVDAYLESSEEERKHFTEYPMKDYGPIEDWCFEGVQDFSKLFLKLTAATFNADLSRWDVSKATDLSSMFATAESFNGDISSWNLGSALDLNNMFRAATSFNQDLSTWNVGSVKNMAHMFCDSFYDFDLSSWDVSQVTDISHMFCRDPTFNQDISRWNVYSVQDMSSMFAGATSFNQNLCAWSPRFATSPVAKDMFNDTVCPIERSPLFTTSQDTPFCYSCT